jgi:hypothetical protein
MNTFKSLLLLTALSIMLSGCGTITGTRTTSKVNPKFNPGKYNRFFINATDDSLCFKPAEQSLLTQGLMPYDGKSRERTLFAYMSNSSGLCFPQFNTKYPLWFRFVFPTTAKVLLKDAKTSETMVEVDYERGYFSTGPGEELCTDSVKDELDKVFKKAMLDKLPEPINLMNSGSLQK